MSQTRKSISKTVDNDRGPRFAVIVTAVVTLSFETSGLSSRAYGHARSDRTRGRTSLRKGKCMMHSQFGAGRGHRLKMAAAVMALATLLAACGGGSDSSGSSETGELDESASLFYSFDGFIPNLDPHQNPGGQQTTVMFTSYDRLIHLTPDGTPSPGLATEWTLAEDGTSINLVLREGVTFHDGTPFTAASVQASLERAATSESANPAVSANAAKITEFVVNGDHDITLEFSEPYFAVEYDLALQLGAMISEQAIADDLDLANEVAGAGPYQLTEWRPNEAIKYARFEDYWEPEDAAVATLEIQNMPDSTTRLNALRSGQLQLTSIQGSQVPTAEQAELEVTTIEALGSYMIFLNADQYPAWKNENLRMAWQHAVDRQGLANAISGGLSNPTVQQLSAASPHFNEDYPGDYYTQDVEKAEEFLAAAAAEGVTETDIDVLVLNRPEDVAIAEAVQGQLAEVGITMEVNITEPANYGLFVEGEEQALVATWVGRVNPAETLTNTLMPKGSFQPADWMLPDVEAKVNEALALPVGPERDAAVTEAFGLAAMHGLYMSIYSVVANVASTDCVTGFTGYLGSGPDLRGVGIKANCS